MLEKKSIKKKIKKQPKSKSKPKIEPTLEPKQISQIKDKPTKDKPNKPNKLNKTKKKDKPKQIIARKIVVEIEKKEKEPNEMDYNLKVKHLLHKIKTQNNFVDSGIRFAWRN